MPTIDPYKRNRTVEFTIVRFSLPRALAFVALRTVTLRPDTLCAEALRAEALRAVTAALGVFGRFEVMNFDVFLFFTHN
jgi:hypothetical protein